MKIISGSNNKCAKRLVWVHSDFTKCSGIFDWFNNEEKTKKAYKCFDKIICVSKFAKEKFIERMDINENVVVKYNINLVDEIKEKSLDRVEEQFNNRFTVSTVGRLVEAKGYDRLLRVHKRLIDDGIIYNLIIIGDGAEREKLNNYIEDNNLNESVYLLGRRDNPYKYIKNSDLFVCSSRWEGFSTVISEAIILGKPVITTRVSGTEELFLNNEYGLIVDNDEDSLYEGLKTILINRDLYDKYNKKILERSDFFDINKLVSEIEVLL